MPSDALGTLPYPLLRLIYPAQVSSRSPSPSPPLDLPAPTVKDPTISKTDNLSAAERLREQMRRDMLSQFGGEEEGDVRFGVRSAVKDEDERPPTKEEEVKREKRYEGVDWQSMVSGTKKVLTMDVSDLTLPLVESLLIHLAGNTLDLPHFTTSSRTPVLLLVRVQVQIIRRDGGTGRLSR